MRMLLSSCTAQRSTMNRAGNFSRLAVMRARYLCFQVRSDNEEALKHVLKDACEQVHLEYSITRLETPASNGRGENSVRTMKEGDGTASERCCLLVGY